MTRRARCVVFDIDDTLYLERDYVRSGFRAVGGWVRERLGVEGLGERAWEAFEAGVRRTILDQVVGSFGLEPDLVGTLVEVYRRHRPTIALLPDAAECLERLLGRVALGSVSDGPVESQRAKALALGLGSLLSPIVLTAELGAGHEKPDPRAFRLVEERTGCRGIDCTYVADNPSKDFAAPTALGWTTVRVRRPLGLHHDVESGPDVDAEVPDLADLDRILSLAA